MKNDDLVDVGHLRKLLQVQGERVNNLEATTKIQREAIRHMGKLVNAAFDWHEGKTKDFLLHEACDAYVDYLPPAMNGKKPGEMPERKPEVYDDPSRQHLLDLWKSVRADIRAAPDYPGGGPVHDALCEVSRRFWVVFREDYPAELDEITRERQSEREREKE